MIQLNRFSSVGLLALLALAACEQTSAPVRRDILGSWESIDFPAANIVMTLAETARSIEGAGGWSEDGTVQPFRVFGALARDEVSLYFDFDEGSDVSFQGFFTNDEVFEGVLFGGPLSGQAITFEKQRLGED